MVLDGLRARPAQTITKSLKFLRKTDGFGGSARAARADHRKIIEIP